MVLNILIELWYAFQWTSVIREILGQALDIIKKTHLAQPSISLAQPSKALSGTVCIINSYSALLNWPIVSLLILFVLFSNVFCIYYMTILYALLVLLVTELVTTITSLYDLTI